MVQKKLALRSSNKDRMEDILDYDEDRILADDPPTRSEKGKEGKKFPRSQVGRDSELNSFTITITTVR